MLSILLISYFAVVSMTQGASMPPIDSKALKAVLVIFCSIADVFPGNNMICYSISLWKSSKIVTIGRSVEVNCVKHCSIPIISCDIVFVSFYEVRFYVTIMMYTRNSFCMVSRFSGSQRVRIYITCRALLTKCGCNVVTLKYL